LVSKARYLIIVDYAKHVEYDGFIPSTQQKKVGFVLNLAEMLYNTSPIKGIYWGTYCCLSASIRMAKNLKHRPTKAFLHFTITRNFLILPRIF
jgi:hypothetical protein